MGSFSSIPFELSVAYFFPNRYFKEKEIISKGSWGISVDRQYDWHLWTKFCYVSAYIYGYKELANMSAWMVRQKLLIQINKRNPGFPSTFSEKKTLRDHPPKVGKYVQRLSIKLEPRSYFLHVYDESSKKEFQTDNLAVWTRVVWFCIAGCKTNWGYI